MYICQFAYQIDKGKEEKNIFTLVKTIPTHFQTMMWLALRYSALSNRVSKTPSR